MPLQRLYLDCGGAPLDYLLRLSTRRATICVQVLPGGEVRVAAPAAAAPAEIEVFLGRHLSWIRSKQEVLRDRLPRAPAVPSGDGTALPLLGRALVLRERLAPGARPAAAREGTELIVCAQTAAQIPALVVGWYREAARHHVSTRVSHFAARVGRSPSRLTIRSQKTRWGSCSGRGTISINWRLMQASGEILDYVVVHELCHLVHRDHSARFWREVAHILPDYRRLRAELRSFGRNLAF